MPELPDLQVFSRNLHKRLKGKSVKKIIVHRSKRLNVTGEQLQKALEQQTLQEIRREGKELVLAFEKGDILSFHLMLNGEIHVFEGKNEIKYKLLEIAFEDGIGLVLSDRRGLAKATLNPGPAGGVDALSDEITPDFLKVKLAAKSTSIKNFLLDQNIISGIGNAYADEILWKAGISPFSVSRKIPMDKIRDLVDAIRTILKEAEKKILEKHPDIIHGEIRDFLLIHSPDKKESPNGEQIISRIIGSRKTYFTQEQELFK